MFEKEAEEYLGNFADCANCKERWSVCAGSLDEYCLVNGGCYATPKEQDIYIAGAEFGYNKALEEWEKCFLACSSPFCSKHFPTVESGGVLGNMEKKENLKRGAK